MPAHAHTHTTYWKILCSLATAAASTSRRSSSCSLLACIQFILFRSVNFHSKKFSRSFFFLRQQRQRRWCWRWFILWVEKTVFAIWLRMFPFCDQRAIKSVQSVAKCFFFFSFCWLIRECGVPSHTELKLIQRNEEKRFIISNVKRMFSNWLKNGYSIFAIDAVANRLTWCCRRCWWW